MDLRPINTPAPLAMPAPGSAVASPPAYGDAQPVTAFAPAAAGKMSKSVEAPTPPSPEKLAQAIKNINHALQDRSQNLEFSVDSATDRTIVKIIDKQTQEVIRQMPSQEAIDIAKALDQLQSLMGKQKA